MNLLKISPTFSLAALAKMLFVGHGMYIDMECKQNFEDGACAQDDVAFFVQTRHHDVSDALVAEAKEEIRKRTHGCYDLSALETRPKSGGSLGRKAVCD